MKDLALALRSVGLVRATLARFVRENPRFRLRDFPVPPETSAYLVSSHEPLWIRPNGQGGDIAVLSFDPSGGAKVVRTERKDDGKMPDEVAGSGPSDSVAVIERHEYGFVVRIRL